MKKLWYLFAFVVLGSFLVLGWSGIKIYQEAPPIPEKVVVGEKVLFTKDDINTGKSVWQATGGMEMGSIWGHGSYVAQDWSSDWIHREALFILEELSQKEFQNSYESLTHKQKEYLKFDLKEIIRTNTYNSASETLLLSEYRAKAFESNLAYYSKLFSEGDAQMAIQKGAVTDKEKLADLTTFIFWTGWAASTNRPGEAYTYTSNWPHEPLIGNNITADSVMWSVFSVLLLLFATGALVFYYVSKKEDHHANVPDEDPFKNITIFPSQKAVIKYFWVISLLVIAQISFGILTAHYGVEGQDLFGIPTSNFLPYSVSRTWHTQFAVFWIATAWLATGIFMGPLVSGVELTYQKLGVNVLFGALLVVVLGATVGEWLGVAGYLQGTLNFFFGHQGYEYMDMGRFWQIALAIGLGLWLFLVGRNITHAIKQKQEARPLLTLFLISAIAIGVFFLSGLMYGEHTHLSVVNYWRWWLVHLWVEGFFEVFATVVIAILFARMGLLSYKTANKTTVLSASIFLFGGIIGTLHHLYYAGTPTAVIALGASFSALEVVPLILIGYEAWETYKTVEERPWVRKYKWPIYFFVAVAFWNMLGAGVFGFMINPPIALYYIQGLNTTAVHAHSALFGVYGVLGLGLMLFAIRVIQKDRVWNEKLIKQGFWCMNIGLLAMVVISLLPVGIIQAITSIKQGYWHARSADLLYSPAVTTFKWLRVVGDVIFTYGIVVFVIFIFKNTLLRNKDKI